MSRSLFSFITSKKRGNNWRYLKKSVNTVIFWAADSFRRQFTKKYCTTCKVNQDYISLEA